MNAPKAVQSNKSRRPRWPWILLAVIAGGGLLFWASRGGFRQPPAATFEVRRGPLDITIMEGGSIRAVDSQEIKCEVRVGYQGMKILKIVDEGYEVTTEDIRTNKVLVELDSSDLQKQIVQQDIQYESAAATLTDAQQAYEIQLNQNLSDIKASEQKVRFARMDFDKFLGGNITQALVDKIAKELEMNVEDTATGAVAAATSPGEAAGSDGGLRPGPKRAEVGSASITLAKDGNGSRAPAEAVELVVPASPAQPPPAVVPATLPPATKPANPPPAPKPEPAPLPVLIDFSEYANIDALGDGEAKQKLRKFEDDLQVARKEEGQAKATLEGTKRLFEKGFVTRIDLEKDEIASENSRLKVQTAGTARDLFLRYEFPKTAEESLSKYAETARELVRARKAAVSKLAQAHAKLKSAQGQFNIQARQKKEFYEQLDKCTITATKPGLVVYGRGGEEGMFFGGGEERIREGATVRERQSIITIPDLSKMSVRVRVHESYIKQVKKGQRARITIDAYADKIIDGEVTSVGVLPDSQNMWMNPDMKVYLTTITLSGTNEWMKPGMSAKVEILVNRLEDAIYVPLQAVSPFQGKQVCYVAGSHKPQRRVVEIGEANDEFIQIKSGVKPGEQVLLRPAEAPASQQPGGQKKDETTPPPKPSAPPVQVTSKT